MEFVVSSNMEGEERARHVTQVRALVLVPAPEQALQVDMSYEYLSWPV